MQPPAPGAPRPGVLCDGAAAARALEGPVTSALAIEPPKTVTTLAATPVAEHQYDTAGGTRVTAVALVDYHPATTPRPLVPADRKLDRYLRRFDRGASRNAENMDREAVWGEIQQWRARATSAAALDELGVTDLAHLSPRQAMQVATLITQDALFYDQDLVSEFELSVDGLRRYFHIHAVLGWPAERFFSEGGAACREYSDVMHAVFEVLKERQHAETSELVNSYMKLPTTYDHVWNALYTVQPNGEVLVTQVDPSWTDTGDAGRLGNIDYTFGVRDYWRQLALLEGTGKRPLREFQRRFEERGAHDPHRRRISNRSMRRAGGLSALARAFDALPAPLQLLALERMERHVRRQLIDERAARGLATATEEPAQH